jgi:hypothetical protein
VIAFNNIALNALHVIENFITPLIPLGFDVKGRVMTFWLKRVTSGDLFVEYVSK